MNTMMDLLWDQKCPNLLESPKTPPDNVEKEITDNNPSRTETLETETKPTVRRNSRKLLL